MKLVEALTLLVLLSACGGEGGVSSNHQQGEEREEDNNLPNFSTRLTNNLLISGEQCSGDESTESQGRTFNCESTEWLITVDNLNFCTPEGCKEVQVVPVIGILIPTSSQSETIFFDIAASIPVSDTITNILNSITVRFQQNQTPLVHFK